MCEVRRTRGVWGMPPREILHFVPSEEASDAILGNIARH